MKYYQIIFAIIPIYHLTSIVLFSLVLFIDAISSFFANKKRKGLSIKKIQNDDLSDDDFQRIISTMYLWERSFITWMALGYFLKIASVYSTIVIIYIAGTTSDINAIILYSILSLLFVIFDLLLNPLKTSSGFRIAYTKIKTTVYKYNSNQIDYRILLLCFNDCEDIISNGFLL